MTLTQLRMRWILHHDNSPGHMATTVQQFLAGKQTALIPQPPYSPYLTLGNFWLLSKLNMRLLGQCFVTPEDTKFYATASLHTVPKEAFHKRFRAWQNCCSVCPQKGCTSKMIRLDSTALKYLSFMVEFWQHYDTPMELQCWSTSIPTVPTTHK